VGTIFFGLSFPGERIDPMSGNSQKSDLLANEILRQITRMENTRVWRAQPVFAIDEELPARLNSLLEEMDRAEHRQVRRA
jgi:hypothetical protein